jgi:hypothetical protein
MAVVLQARGKERSRSILALASGLSKEHHRSRWSYYRGKLEDKQWDQLGQNILDLIPNIHLSNLLRNSASAYRRFRLVPR